jgi:hypothetical protein
MESTKDEDETDAENERLNLTEEADREFNTLYGFIDSAMQVAKECGISYFDIIEHPCIHVLGLSNYINEKAKKIETHIKNGNPKS